MNWSWNTFLFGFVICLIVLFMLYLFYKAFLEAEKDE